MSQLLPPARMDPLIRNSLRNGLKLFQFTEGAYYALEAVDLGGDAGSLPARVDEAIRQDCHGQEDEEKRVTVEQHDLPARISSIA